MIDWSNSRVIALNNLAIREKVRVLDETEKRTFNFHVSYDVWEIDTGISINGTYFQLVLHIVLDESFPLSLPKIYLSPKSYKDVGFIPHVDTSRFVCTFDSEISFPDTNNPIGVINECLKRAQKIISDGLTNTALDFEDEFKAYWDQKYQGEANAPIKILSLVETIMNYKDIKLLRLDRPVQSYKFILHGSDDTASRFKFFLNEQRIGFTEVETFYLESSFLIKKPPFLLRNVDAFRLYSVLNLEGQKQFRRFFNEKSSPKLVFTKKLYGEKECLLGWIHKPLRTNVKGFRKQKPFNVFSNKHFQLFDIVERFSVDTLTFSRLERRTSGKENIQQRCFLFAGLGSVGSNLLQLLNASSSYELRLIDTEKLFLENIGRHFLGFESVGEYKAEALKKRLQKNNPLQKVSSKNDSIVNVVRSEVDYINGTDYIFVSIGKRNIDNWLCEALAEGIITKPMFILWVEPYLCGGHCLFLHPQDPGFKKYFVDDFFKFNVIASSEYVKESNQLFLRESGCQTTFVPYSIGGVRGFLSAIFPKILNIIDSGDKVSKSISWIGSTEEVKKLGIELSDVGKKYPSGDVIEKIL